MNPQETMSEATIQLAYDGEALRSGSMDVRDLAPALLSIGQLCERANEILNDGHAEISVKVRSDFKTGSFDLNLDVTQSLLEAAKYVFSHKDQVSTAKELLEIVGLLGAGSVAKSSLLYLIKWLKGRKADKTTALENGNVRVIINNNIQISDNSGQIYLDVKPQVVELYNDEEIRKAALGAIKPLESDGIDTFAVRDGKETIELITSEDLPSFAALSDSPPDELLLESDRNAALTIIKPSFDSELKWMFAEGEARFSATMQDHKFLDQLSNRQIAFAKGDILIVRLMSKSFRTATGLRTEHKIPAVIEIKSAPRQISLLPPPSEE